MRGHNKLARKLIFIINTKNRKRRKKQIKTEVIFSIKLI